MLRIVSALFLVAISSLPAQAGERIALLIGNRAYDPSVGVLNNPHNDIVKEAVLASTSPPATPPSSSAPVTECDRLVTAELDRNAAPAVATRDVDHARAAVACEEAVAKYPGVARFWFNLALSHAAAGEFDRAIGGFNKAIELDPKNAVAYSNRGFAYYNKQDYERAFSDFNTAIELKLPPTITVATPTTASTTLIAPSPNTPRP